LRHYNNDSPRAYIPYVEGVSNKIDRQEEFESSFHQKKANLDNIKKTLKYEKDFVGSKLGSGVYITPCSCGHAYIGGQEEPFEKG